MPTLSPAPPAESRLALFQSCVPLAHQMARRYERFGARHGLELADLEQEALAGLWHATERFDPGRGFKFITFAWHWIRQGIGRGIFNSRRRARLHIEADLPAVPIEDSRMGLVEHLAGGGQALATGRLQSAEEAADAAEARELIRPAVARLQKRLRRVLTLRFGLDDGAPRSLDDIAFVLGVSRERVRQLECQAVQKVAVMLLRRRRRRELAR